MRWHRALALVFCVGLSLQAAIAQSGNAQVVQTINLPPEVERRTLGAATSRLPECGEAHIAFLENNTIAAYWLRPPDYAVSDVEQRSYDAFASMHLELFDAATGARKRAMDWPIRLHWRQVPGSCIYYSQPETYVVLPIRGGGFAYFDESRLRTYSDTGELISERLGRVAWTPTVQRDGTEIVLIPAKEGVGGTTVEWIDARSLRTTRPPITLQNGAVVAAGETAAFLWEGVPSRLIVHLVDGSPPRPLCADDLCGWNRVQIPSRDDCFIEQYLEVGLVSGKGQILWTLRSDLDSEGDSFLDAHESLNGTRFVFGATTVHHGRHVGGMPVQKGVTLYVYSRADRVLRATVPIRRQKRPRWQGDLFGLDYALSPEGSSLAVLYGSQVTLYKLPSGH